MRKSLSLLITVISIISISSCSNNKTIDYGYGKEKSRFSEKINQYYDENGIQEFYDVTGNTPEVIASLIEEKKKMYGENKEIVGDYDTNLAAYTPYGTYVGKVDENNIISWKGMPYAKAPIKELRWKAPQKLDKSNKVYEAYYFGHTSIQIQTRDEDSSFYPQGEDCLNINIWSNKNSIVKNKPIMLWIHGGAYIGGGTSSEFYEGTNFVKNNPDVIYASIDYRTDFIGFVNLSQVPGGEKYKESANLGLLDQIASLNWLKENAASFGGDPERITIFGESAGGGSVSALTIIPEAKGLFKRAIIQSGSSTNFLRTAEQSIKQTQQMLDICGAKTMNDLLELTDSDMRKLSAIIITQGPSAYTFPQLDGIILPFDIKSKLYDDTRDGIDILCGTTKDEYEYWTYISTPDINFQSMQKTVKSFTDCFNEDETSRWNTFMDGLKGSEYKKYIEAINYLSFHTPCRFESKTHADNGQKVYQYLFTEEINGTYIDPTTQKVNSYGSFHAQELGFLFDHIDPEEYLCCTKEEAKRLSNIMQKMWVNFAITGNPSLLEGDVSGVEPINWDNYTSDNNNVMVLNAKGSQQMVDPLKDNIDLIGDLYWARISK